MKLYSIHFFYVFFLSLCITGFAEEEQALGDNTRELLIFLAEDGTKESYQEIERMLENLSSDQPLLAGERGKFKAKRSIDTALSIVGDRGDEASYQLLERLMRRNFEDHGALDSKMRVYILSNLLKYRDTKSDALLDLLSEGVDLFSEKSVEALKLHSFVNQEGIYYHFPHGDYVNQVGEIVHNGSVNKGVRYDRLVDGLRVIGNQRAYDLMLDYFSSWMAREDGTLMNNIELHLKERRYDSPVIGIYDTLFNDDRLHPDTRNRIITALFSNKPVHYSTHIDNPEEFYPQLDEIDQERLIRLLGIAENALDYNLLTTETVELLESKRSQILQLLSAMSYEPKHAKEISVEMPVATEVEPEAPVEVAAVVESSEGLGEQSSNWWLWLIGLLVVVVGGVLVVRRKS